MSKFKGFALIRLIRATNVESKGSDQVAYSYEYELHTKMGIKKVDFMTDNHRRNNYSKHLLMRGDDTNHAVLRDDGKWHVVTAAEYHDLAAEWERA